MTDTATPTPVGKIAAVKKYFGNKPGENGLAAFKAEWDALTDQDKLDLSNGLLDGTYNY